MQTERILRVHAPNVATLSVFVAAGPGVNPSPSDRHREVPMVRGAGGAWSASVAAADGDRYWLVADGIGPLLDPSAAEVVITDDGPLGMFRGRWPVQPRLVPGVDQPVVYEVHVRGMARTFEGVIERLAYLADLGVNVIELLPVHPFDDADNYWGYMPLVWGAVHAPYSNGTDPAAALARLVGEAHRHGIEVWLDVVVNHTGEGDAMMPTRSLRGLDDAHAYLHRPDGGYVDDTGCGNTVNPADREIRRLVFEALDRFADLGVDGFRFDLASILTRDGGELVHLIGDWARRREVRLVAEAWDLAAYQVGPGFPDQRWAQWNDRFRDDGRGFLRGEPGLVPAMIHRVSGSPDLFPDDPARSINFLTAHDGLTLFDLTTVTSDRHRSWDCGDELRPQMLRNAFCLLLLSAGTPMFVMGDEFARTQHGHDNPYNIDSPLTWVDWQRRSEWSELVDDVGALLALRRRAGAGLRSGAVRCFGVNGGPDETYESRSLAWATDELYVMANMWWEPLAFVIAERGPWQVEFVTVGHREPAAPIESGATVVVAPRSVTVLTREGLNR